jgi:iron complex outermembrane receptor protein
VRYAFTKRLTLAVGANNLFDTCPIGINGRQMYTRVDWAF